MVLNRCKCGSSNVDRSTLRLNYAGVSETCQVVKCYGCGNYTAVSMLGKSADEAFQEAARDWNAQTNLIQFNK